MYGETMVIASMIGQDNHSIAICTRSVFPLVNISQLEERKETLISKTSTFKFFPIKILKNLVYRINFTIKNFPTLFLLLSHKYEYKLNVKMYLVLLDSLGSASMGILRRG